MFRGSIVAAVALLVASTLSSAMLAAASNTCDCETTLSMCREASVKAYLKNLPLYSKETMEGDAAASRAKCFAEAREQHEVVCKNYLDPTIVKFRCTESFEISPDVHIFELQKTITREYPPHMKPTQSPTSLSPSASPSLSPTTASPSRSPTPLPSSSPTTSTPTMRPTFCRVDRPDPEECEAFTLGIIKCDTIPGDKNHASHPYTKCPVACQGCLVPETPTPTAEPTQPCWAKEDDPTCQNLVGEVDGEVFKNLVCSEKGHLCPKYCAEAMLNLGIKELNGVKPCPATGNPTVAPSSSPTSAPTSFIAPTPFPTPIELSCNVRPWEHPRCQNGGQCVDGPERFSCRCRKALGYAWGGLLCQHQYNCNPTENGKVVPLVYALATESACENGGTCERLNGDINAGTRCRCKPTFYGDHCESFTEKPTGRPTPKPTSKPTTPQPTKYPTTLAPTEPPSVSPSSTPSTSPTRGPTKIPTRSPSAHPSRSPSMTPSSAPSASPSTTPTSGPTGCWGVKDDMEKCDELRDLHLENTKDYSREGVAKAKEFVCALMEIAEDPYCPIYCGLCDVPSPAPSASPTQSPSKSPSESPTKGPSVSPTHAPSSSPTPCYDLPDPVLCGTCINDRHGYKKCCERNFIRDTYFKGIQGQLEEIECPLMCGLCGTPRPTFTPTRSPTSKAPTAAPTESPTRNPTTLSPTSSPTPVSQTCESSMRGKQKCNGGLCKDGPSGFTCDCTPKISNGFSWGGPRCSELYNCRLDGVPDSYGTLKSPTLKCKNGGTCVSDPVVGGSLCACSELYEGTQCQIVKSTTAPSGPPTASASASASSSGEAGIPVWAVILLVVGIVLLVIAAFVMHKSTKSVSTSEAGVSSSFMERFHNGDVVPQQYSMNPSFIGSQMGAPSLAPGSVGPSMGPPSRAGMGVFQNPGYSNMEQMQMQMSYGQGQMYQQAKPGGSAAPSSPSPTDYLAFIQDKIGNFAPQDSSGNVVLKYQKEFADVPKQKQNPGFQAAHEASKQSKNRYTDVLAYDDTRVKLSSAEDYINANFVRLRCGNETFRYILAQGPLNSTIEDFYTMIWDQKVRFIIMLAKIEENGKQKCAAYWPENDGQTQAHGAFEVTSRRDTSYNADSDGFACRTLYVKNTASGEAREVLHLQFTAWPDHDIPEDTLQFLNFVQKKREVTDELNISQSEPVLVHCSAGVGRTGVFCLTEYALSCVENGLGLDFPTTLKSMRDQRPQLVQNEDQYKFCYSVVLDALHVDSMGTAEGAEFEWEDDDNVGSSEM